jgi:hypothetical protein
VPAGARKGGFGLDIPAGAVLYNRLAEHAESIQAARNLSVEDFACRYLVVDDIWIPLGESLLIEMFSPIWNHLVDGFGNHDPGKGRYQQQRAPWDVLHPGRNWADRLQPHPKSEKELLKAIEAYLAKGSRECERRPSNKSAGHPPYLPSTQTKAPRAFRRISRTFTHDEPRP